MDATSCFHEVQFALAKREAASPADQRLQFRVGIRLGDVIDDEEGDIFGEGVHLRSRLHVNEAFSSMALTSHKNFLSLHIGARGALAVYPIGIDRAVHRWRLDPDNSDPEAPWLAADDAGLRPRLIEEPIRIEPGPGAQPC